MLNSKDAEINKQLANDNIPTEDIGNHILARFRSMSVIDPDIEMKNNAQEWKDMCEEFNALQQTKTNKIPRTLFETRYSMFFNRANMNTFGRRSHKADLWSDRSNEFLKLIDPYRPFQVVDDYNPNIVIKTFPPIFREVNTLNTKKATDPNDPTVPRDEEGNIIDTNYLCSVVTNVFDKFSNHQLPAKRREGAEILSKCLMNVQDMNMATADAIITQNIISEFHKDDNKQDESTTNSEEMSSEDCGVMWE